MKEQLSKQSVIEVVISFFLGIMLAFSSFVYITLYIYTDFRSLVIPTILLILGISIVGWGVYKIKRLGKIIDDEEVDFGEK